MNIENIIHDRQQCMDRCRHSRRLSIHSSFANTRHQRCRSFACKRCYQNCKVPSLICSLSVPASLSSWSAAPLSCQSERYSCSTLDLAHRSTYMLLNRIHFLQTNTKVQFLKHEVIEQWRTTWTYERDNLLCCRCSLCQWPNRLFDSSNICTIALCWLDSTHRSQRSSRQSPFPALSLLATVRELSAPLSSRSHTSTNRHCKHRLHYISNSLCTF